MAGINDILNISRAGLAVNQKALQVTGNNVSNVNTPGYSRQRINFDSIGGGQLNMNIGVSVAEIRRVHDSFLEQQVNLHHGSYQFTKGRQLLADQLNNVFLEVGENGINSAMNGFFNAFNNLANNPSGGTERQMLVTEAETLGLRINRAAENLADVRKSVDTNIESEIETVNGLLSNLARLNKEIVVNSDPKGEIQPSGLLDERNQVLRELNQAVDVTSFTDEQGNINVILGNNLIVESDRHGSLAVIPGDYNGVEMTAIAGTKVDITERLTQENGRGRLSGMLVERDVYLENKAAELDQFAFSLAERVNTLHGSGFGLDGNDGRDFFTALTDVEGAAKAFSVDSDIKGNTDFIAASATLDGLPGDNSIALAIFNLQDDQTAISGTSFNDYFDNMVGEASSHAASLHREAGVQLTVLDQAEAYRESIAGVSIDEEMVSLIKFQRAFEASAKMITTVDAMMQTVIDLKR